MASLWKFPYYQARQDVMFGKSTFTKKIVSLFFSKRKERLKVIPLKRKYVSFNRRCFPKAIMYLRKMHVPVQTLDGLIMEEVSYVEYPIIINKTYIINTSDIKMDRILIVRWTFYFLWYLMASGRKDSMKTFFPNKNARFAMIKAVSV